MGAESGRFDAYALTKERSVNEEEVMAKPSGLQKALSVVDQGKRKKLISFATIYNNDIRFPAHYDLERAFGKTITAIQQQASRYRSFRNLHPDWHLPFLVGRQVARGGLLEVPESVMKQLDQFRYETAEFVRDAKKAGGFLVTSAQFGAPLNPWVWKAFQQYSKVTGFPIAVLPIKYGPLQTWHQEENGEVKVKLASSFPDELKGHVLLEDALLCGVNCNSTPYVCGRHSFAFSRMISVSLAVKRRRSWQRRSLSSSVVHKSVVGWRKSS